MGQSLSNILIHVVFSTKDRNAYIDEEIQSKLYAYMTALAVDQGSYIHQIGGLEDHVHLLMSLSRTVSVSKLIEEIKKNSSKWIKLENSKYTDFSWQKGYGTFSVSFSHLEKVSKYIQNQKDHHEILSYQDEFRGFLKLQKIPFDEKYVWE